MLQALILIVFFPGLFTLLSWPVRKKMADVSSPEEANKLKRQIRLIWVLVFVLYVVAAFSFTYLAYFSASDTYRPSHFNLRQWFVAAAVSLFIIIRNYKFPICTDLPDEVCGVFVLLLESFEKEPSSSNEAEDNNEVFMEKLLAKRLHKKVKFFTFSTAIEIYPPAGLRRVYTNEDRWQSDMQRLMESSRINLLLISDSESCIWEIEHSMGMLPKTVFIVDDLKQYEKVREQMADKIQFPEITPSEQPDISFFFFENSGKCPVYHITSRSKEDYQPLADLIIYNTPKAKFKDRFSKVHSALDVISRFK